MRELPIWKAYSRLRTRFCKPFQIQWRLKEKYSGLPPVLVSVCTPPIATMLHSCFARRILPCIRQSKHTTVINSTAFHRILRSSHLHARYAFETVAYETFLHWFSWIFRRVCSKIKMEAFRLHHKSYFSLYSSTTAASTDWIGGRKSAII